MKKIDLKKKKVTKKSKLAACVMKLYCILFIIGEAFILLGPLFVVSYYNFGSFYPLKFKDTTWCVVKYFYICKTEYTKTFSGMAKILTRTVSNTSDL